ncbi:MAG: TerB family tellurite resistance protein [Muribaculaceae bacterium]|nr:TerB family tellurite resistance protein [Muribaculaceae bacterium]
MAFGKWIGGFIGWMTAGPLGALAGFAIGAIIDSDAKNSSNQTTVEHNTASPESGQRNSFLFSMLVMASYIIKADGKIMHSEMEFVRQFLRNNFGPEAAIEGNQILLNLFERRKQMDAINPSAFRSTIYDCGRQIASNLTYEERLQLLRFLAMIAQSDGHVCDKEIEALKEVASAMGLSTSEVDSMLNLGRNTLDAAYKVLEISPTATDDEVKAAYRKLALKHHPDRVASLGEDIRKAAEEKFRQINEAKDKIYKERGIS